MSDEVDLSKLSAEEWLRSFEDYTQPAEGKRGPLNRGTGVAEVVPGVYSDWHYDALAIRCLLKTVLDQRKEIRTPYPPVVVLDVGEAGALDPHSTRTPNFFCVEWSWRTMAYTFRIPLQLDGVNDMQGRKFDFWFEWLKEAAASGKAARVTVSVRPSGSPYHQKGYTGVLCKTGNMAPRLCADNSSLFEFDLCEVVAAETMSTPL